MEDPFGIREAGSTPWREIWAGCTTFLAMAYITAVNPAILAEAGMPRSDVFAATCLASALATAVMGLWARYPVALAPGMGLNAFFAFSICKGLGAPWEVALSAVLVAGVVFLILSLGGIREKLLAAVPPVLTAGCAGGIGLFIALIGLQKAGIVAPNPATMIAMGDLSKGAAPYAAGGILLTMLLVSARVPGALLLGIGATWILLVLGGAAPAPQTWVRAPAPPEHTPGKAFLHLSKALSPEYLGVVAALVFVDLFDTMGTLLALASGAGMLREDGSLPRASRAFTADALGTILGGILGTSTVTSYIESGAGMAAGGRTGLTALVTAALFLLALPFAPLVAAVPEAAAAPALVLVGAFLLHPLKRVHLENPADAVPVLVMVLGMPACYSIEKGLGFGFIAYVLCRAGAGRFKEISPLVWFLALAFLARFVFLPHV